MLTFRFIVTGLLAAILLPVPHARGGDLPVEAFAAPAPAHMSMTYRKGILFIRVDVMDLDIQLGGESGETVRKLADAGNITRAAADSIAALAVGSQDALVGITFRRDIGLDRFLSEARKTTKHVWEHGLISKEEYTRVSRNLPLWYQSLEERGILNGDRMFYRIQGDRLHTVFQGKDGRLFVDQVDEGPEPRRAVLGGYFYDGSDFREDLIKSLTDTGGGE